jgi:hypothetical protein
VALAQVIAKLRHEDGRILIPGFYDEVRQPSADELKAWKALPFNEEHYRKTEIGSVVLMGEPGALACRKEHGHDRRSMCMECRADLMGLGRRR